VEYGAVESARGNCLIHNEYALREVSCFFQGEKFVEKVQAKKQEKLPV
jgi:hypothetical protein